MVECDVSGKFVDNNFDVHLAQLHVVLHGTMHMVTVKVLIGNNTNRLDELIPVVVELKQMSGIENTKF